MLWTRPKYRTAPASADAKGRSLLRFLVILAILAWALRCFVVAPFNIPTGSMLPTLYIGDYLLVAKWPYGYSRYSFPFTFPSFNGRVFPRAPKRGDVVVFRPPGADTEFVKRVIGLPGDTIAVLNGMLILNGRPLPRREMRPFAMPVSPNSPCKVVPPATPFVTNVRGQIYCLYPAYRETLPGGPTWWY